MSKILIINAKDSPLRPYLTAHAEIFEFQVPDDDYLLDNIPPRKAIDPKKCFEIARSYSGRFDYILAEGTAAFLWHAIFRLTGDETPFIIIPRFNHIFGKNSYALLLSSQLASPQDILFCGSKAASRSFGNFGFQSNPLYLPGINLETYRTLPDERDTLRNSLKLPIDQEILLFVGRLVDDKNIVELLNIFSIVKKDRDIHLAICFHFLREDYYHQCQELAKSIGNVSFIYKPNKEALIQHYNAADLFVSAATSVFETFGRAPIEAMACGTPPIVCEYDGFRETITEDTGFLVPTTYSGHRKWPDVTLFAESILKALDDRESLQERSRAGIEHARKYSCEASIPEMMTRLDDLRTTTKQRYHPENVSLSKYPAEIRDLWSPLEGKPIKNLVGHFLSTWEIGIKPPDKSVLDFYQLWFSHY